MKVSKSTLDNILSDMRSGMTKKAALEKHNVRPYDFSKAYDAEKKRVYLREQAEKGISTEEANLKYYSGD